MANREDIEQPIQMARRPLIEILWLTLKFLKIYWKIVFALCWLLILIILLTIYNTPVFSLKISFKELNYKKIYFMIFLGN